MLTKKKFLLVLILGMCHYTKWKKVKFISKCRDWNVETLQYLWVKYNMYSNKTIEHKYLDNIFFPSFVQISTFLSLNVRSERNSKDIRTKEVKNE